MKFLNDNGPSLPFILFIYISLLLFINLLGKAEYIGAFLIGIALIFAVLANFFIRVKKRRKHETKLPSTREISVSFNFDALEESAFFEASEERVLASALFEDSEERALKEFSRLIRPFFELSSYCNGSQVSDEDLDYFSILTRITSISLLDAIQLAYRREWATILANQRDVDNWSERRNWAITALERLNRVFPESAAIEDIPIEIVRMVHEKYKYRCSACGRMSGGLFPVAITIDFIIPVGRGGGTIPKNLHLLCTSCKRLNEIGIDMFLLCRLKKTGRVWDSESGRYKSYKWNW